jgi:8-oxo-dGTP pyrophosphatase MutT (NUDIX family)
VAEFDGITAPDGARLFGFEATIPAGRIEPGETLDVVFRIWALPETGIVLSPGLKFTVFEGRTAVAWGEVTGPPFL